MAQEAQAQHTTPDTMAPRGQAAKAERMARAEAIAEKSLALEAAALAKAAAEPVLQTAAACRQMVDSSSLQTAASSSRADDTAGGDGQQQSPEPQAQEACPTLSPPHHTNLQI